MRMDFRINWGYQNLYSRRLYHPTFIWDGSLSCTGGQITEIYQLEYPYSIYGIGHSARQTRLPSPQWVSRTRRRLAGIRVLAEADADAVFYLHTASVDLSFSVGELQERGRLEFPVGPKYLGCTVTVTRTGYLWFLPQQREGVTYWEPDSLGLPVHDWARMRLAWLAPGESVTLSHTVPQQQTDVSELLLHVVGMATPAYDSERETQVNATIPLELYCDGVLVSRFQKYYRCHDINMQLLEDVWTRVRVAPGVHTLRLRNAGEEICLGISRIGLSQHGYLHGQVSVPAWALRGEGLVGKVFAARPDTIAVRVGDEVRTLNCQPGWNEFPLTAEAAGRLSVSTDTHAAQIEVYDCEEESDPIKVGYDMTTVPHDDDGFMDWLLDYTARTRLGNYVVFRSFNGEVDDALLRRWGEFCHTHGIYVSACTSYLSGALADGAKESFHDCGPHEYPGIVYARDPIAPYASATMREAAEKYIAYLRREIDKAHSVCDCAAFGDASGGIRYSFLAGADFVRAETMVGHTMTLLSQARPAAEALGRGRWGVHIAIQHAYQPYRETHLGQYFLCLMQPWLMGADTIYEEDSLFCLFKEERQAWDDLLTKGKRDMTRRFFRFAKTHPRRGKCVRSIAFLEGRYAAPFNGFICDYEQDPHYSVWGGLGNSAPEWGHGQPEKCRHILDVLMPGASALPFIQRHEKHRYFFSGTPYGDFDCIPAEASADYYANYKLLLNLGWHTMTDEDYGKLLEFVTGGGILLTGIPQFSTHTGREFLRDMEELALFRDGELSELCGIRVNGAGERYSGQWNGEGRYAMAEPSISAMPSDRPGEDGEARLADVTLCGAQTVAWDAATGAPMLVRHRVGAGEVYTFTLWAYPGHEQFMGMAAAWVERLARQTLPDIHVEDTTGEVFWTRWVDGDRTRILLLNTDWTEQGNEKTVALVVRGRRHSLTVRERTVVIAEIDGDTVREETFSL